MLAETSEWLQSTYGVYPELRSTCTSGRRASTVRVKSLQYPRVSRVGDSLVDTLIPLIPHPQVTYSVAALVIILY